jgi:hypothetical protein
MNEEYSNKLSAITLSKSKNYLFLFMIWPFLAFITAIINYSQKESRKVVYIFLIYYGLTFVINSATYVDAAGYAMNLKVNAALPFSDFFKIVGGLYASDTSVDIVEPFISFIVSRFTDDYRILYAVFAAIFGFFYLKSIDLLYDRYHENPGWNVGIHLAFFTIIIPITYINGFRMYAAAWIFFYGAYNVILHHDYRYLLIALASSFVHFSFLSANILLIIYFFVGNRNAIYLPIALISFVIPQLFAATFQSISLKLGGGLQSRFESYTNKEFLGIRQESFDQASWFLKSVNDLVFYYILLAIIVIQIRYGYLMKGKAERNLFSFLLLLISFVNFGRAIPSFGARFQIVFLLFATFYVFLYFLKLPGNKINLLTMVGLFPMTLYAVIAFRQGSESISAWILTPGLGFPLFAPSLSLVDLLFH